MKIISSIIFSLLLFLLIHNRVFQFLTLEPLQLQHLVAQRAPHLNLSFSFKPLLGAISMEEMQACRYPGDSWAHGKLLQAYDALLYVKVIFVYLLVEDYCFQVVLYRLDMSNSLHAKHGLGSDVRNFAVLSDYIKLPHFVEVLGILLLSPSCWCGLRLDFISDGLVKGCSLRWSTVSTDSPVRFDLPQTISEYLDRAHNKHYRHESACYHVLVANEAACDQLIVFQYQNLESFLSCLLYISNKNVDFNLAVVLKEQLGFGHRWPFSQAVPLISPDLIVVICIQLYLFLPLYFICPFYFHIYYFSLSMPRIRISVNFYTVSFIFIKDCVKMAEIICWNCLFWVDLAQSEVLLHLKLCVTISLYLLTEVLGIRTLIQFSDLIHLIHGQQISAILCALSILTPLAQISVTGAVKAIVIWRTDFGLCPIASWFVILGFWINSWWWEKENANCENEKIELWFHVFKNAVIIVDKKC